MPWWPHSKQQHYNTSKTKKINIIGKLWEKRQNKNTERKPWGKSSYFTVQSALLFPTDCLSKVTDPWANVTRQSIGCHASGSNIVFLSPRLIRFFTDCLPQKTYQLAWRNQSWGDTIQTRVLFANLLSVMPAKPPLWLPRLSMCWFWSYFSL